MLTNVRFEDLKNIENVKTAVEHISLYVGLVVFTALGAKVGILGFTWQGRIGSVKLARLDFEYTYRRKVK